MSKMNYKVINTATSDLQFIYFLFEKAIEYQRKNNYTVWKGYDKNVLTSDVENELQYKVIRGQEILCIFSICYSDKIIWRDMEQGNAIYIHRMVVNPEHKGHRQFAKVLNWTIKTAQERGLSFIRMDTWADNPNIVEYYKSYGFQFVENYTTPNSPELPSQHRNLGLTLLQYDLRKTNRI